MGENTGMRFWSSISGSETAEDAVGDIIDDAHRATHGRIDQGFCVHHRPSPRIGIQEILERLWLELDPQALVGCSGEGVIGADSEIERAPGIAVLTMELPDVRLHPFHIGGRLGVAEHSTTRSSLRSAWGWGRRPKRFLRWAIRLPRRSIR